jgi:hypothetical protein
MIDKLKIFYAHSNHNDLVSNNTNIIVVCFSDNDNSNYIFDKIKNQIGKISIGNDKDSYDVYYDFKKTNIKYTQIIF